MLKNWIKIYLHQVKHNKFFTTLNILGLGMGIAGLIFAILYWNDEYSYNSWNPNKENVFFTVSDLGDDMVWGSSASPLGPALKASVSQVTEYCYLNGWYNSDIFEHEGKKVMLEKITDAQKNFFSFFPFDFIKGSPDTALGPNSVALSDITAQKLFSDQDPLNKQIVYQGKSFTVKGVYRIIGKSSFSPEAVTNLIDPKLKENEQKWGMFSHGLLLKLKNGNDAALVTKRINDLYYENTVLKNAAAGGLSPEDFIKRFGKTTVMLEPLKDLRLKSQVNDTAEGKGNYQFLLIMMGLSILILTISIVNYVNLVTANAIKRAKEVGVRKILGATKNNIVRQFIFEAVLTTLVSILLALMIVEISLPYYNSFLGKSLTLSESGFYAQLIVIFIVVVLLAGIFPAAYIAKFEVIKVLKGNFSRSKKGIWLRNSMLVLQFAVAFFFIIGSYIVHQQIDYLTHKDLGFKGDQVVDVYYRNPYDYKVEGYREMLEQKYQRTKQQLLKMQGVEEVSTGTFKIGGSSLFQTNFGYNDKEVSMQVMSMDFNLTEMMKIQIVKGRGLSDKIASDTIDSILLNETAVKMINDPNPINKVIMWGSDKPLRIVGIIRDFHLEGPQQKITPMAFFHYKIDNWLLQNSHEIYVKIDPQYMEPALAAIEKLWKEQVDPDYPFGYEFVDKNFARSYENFVNQRNLFSLLNAVVIIIALFGLFALASYSIQRRMKEIAIRKTLGAETRTLLKELTWQYVVFCMIGFVIAFLPAWILLEEWLENFAYRIDISFIPFVAGFIILMALTLLVVLVKAYAATRTEVLQYLKYE